MTAEQDNMQGSENQPGPEQPVDFGSFQDLGLKPTVLAALTEMGFQGPTEVQQQTIPPALQGRDLMVQSRTGSGKTAAFAIPFAQQLVDPAQREVQALVLAPTRELAQQVADECTRVVRSSGLEVISIYGGAAMGPQVAALREGTQVVAGTPGRVLDHIRRGNLKTSAIKVLVLDECDEMLSMGFHEELSAIIEQLPSQRQTLLFSATIPDEIHRMAERYMHDPLELKLSEDFVGVREIKHIYYLISGSDRGGDLLRVLEYENPDLALIFCNTRDDTAGVADFLKGQGFKAEGISSDLTQAEREHVMGQMRAGELRFLVATDIAARGIDITDITHVINYTFPESADVYVHRTGRTGRAGKSGIAVSLVSPREIGSFYYLKLIHRIFPEERRLPAAEELATRREGERLQRLQTLFSEQLVSEEMRNLVRRILIGVDGERVLALALARVLEENKEIYARPLSQPVRRDRPPERDRPPRPDRDRDRGPRDRDRGDRDRRRGGESSPRARSSRGRGRDDDRGRGRGRDDDRGRGRGRDEERRPEPAPAEESIRPEEATTIRSLTPAPAEAEPARERPAAEGERRERKTTRTRRRFEAAETGPEQEQEHEGTTSGTFLTPDGDVEHWEILDSEPSLAPAEAADAGEQDSGGGARLYINVGRRQGARVDELADFLRREAGIGAEELGELRIRDSHTYFMVKPEVADPVIDRLSGKSFKDRMLKVERAKK